MIENIDECKNNPENSSITKVGEYISSSVSISMVLSFENIESKYHVDR